MGRRHSASAPPAILFITATTASLPRPPPAAGGGRIAATCLLTVFTSDIAAIPIAVFAVAATALFPGRRVREDPSGVRRFSPRAISNNHLVAFIHLLLDSHLSREHRPIALITANLVGRRVPSPSASAVAPSSSADALPFVPISIRRRSSCGDGVFGFAIILIIIFVIVTLRGRRIAQLNSPRRHNAPQKDCPHTDEDGKREGPKASNEHVNSDGALTICLLLRRRRRAPPASLRPTALKQDANALRSALDERNVRQKDNRRPSDGPQRRRQPAVARRPQPHRVRHSVAEEEAERERKD